jgi:rhamnose utilization protein RhaD (predicted bifunctional aldolase and dehydrogenase)
MKTPDLEGLISLSNHYGTRTEYVIAGGGNTSYKTDTTLWVKGSGQALGTIREDGFAKMDRAALADLWKLTFSTDTAVREEQVLECLMAARLPGEEAKRPSVETLLHDMLPFTYVVHTHPTLVNALTCGQNGKAVFDRLFASQAVWIPLVDPGYVLSKIVKDALEAYHKVHGKVASVIFLQNHGIVVAANTPAEIRDTYRTLLADLERELKTSPDLNPVGVDAEAEAAFLQELAPVAARELGVKAVFSARSTAKAVLALSESEATFAPLSSAFTPDHIVYMGVSPVRVDHASQLPQAFADYKARWGKAPRVVLAKGLGAFCVGPNAKAAGQAQQLLLDAVQIAGNSPSFGGPLFMTKPAIDFIVNWEVEAFRSAVSSK